MNVDKLPSPLRLDPELAAISVMIPSFDFTDVEGSRRFEQELVAQGRRTVEGVVTEDVLIPRRDGSTIAARVYRPSHVGVLPAILYIHGGGFVLGGLDTEDDRCAYYARDAQCAVVSIDYRLAPEHPFPAAFHDCVDALWWMHDEAISLGIDNQRLSVGGNSAGGAIAASVALASRTDEAPSLVHQLLVNPVLDCRSQTASMQRFTTTPGWNRAQNLLMWELYLADAAVPADYRAAAALAEDVADAPPASIWIAEYDPLRDEGYAYAQRLMAASVPVGIMQYPGTIHGFDGYRMTNVGQRALVDQITALRWALRT
ncbi:alpha/beta hydrolase [Microbacterium sp. CGR1]|uniref:alpha/beta hydrolase n=1 Tax=Microbacterium sp. CGR1 TaxID=1696072 RepID=UPI003DA4D6B7